MNEWIRLTTSVCVCPGDRLRGSEAELAGVVGAVGAEEGDSDWTQEVTDFKKGTCRGVASVYWDCTVTSVLCSETDSFIAAGCKIMLSGLYISFVSPAFYQCIVTYEHKVWHTFYVLHCLCNHQYLVVIFFFIFSSKIIIFQMPDYFHVFCLWK